MFAFRTYFKKLFSSRLRKVVPLHQNLLNNVAAKIKSCSSTPRNGTTVIYLLCENIKRLDALETYLCVCVFGRLVLQTNKHYSIL